MKMLIPLAALSLLLAACSSSDPEAESATPSATDSSGLAVAEQSVELTKEYGLDADEDGESGTIADMEHWFSDSPQFDVLDIYDKAVAVCVEVDAGERAWEEVLDEAEHGALNKELGTDSQPSAVGAITVACGWMPDSEAHVWNRYANVPVERAGRLK